MSKVEGRAVRLRNFTIALKEAVRTGLLNLKLQAEEDAMLHARDLLPRVSVIRQVDKVLDSGRVNLLILGRNDKRGNANELHVRLQYVEFSEVAVDQVNG